MKLNLKLWAFLSCLKVALTGFSLVNVHNEAVTEEVQGLLLYSGGTVCDGPHFGPTEMYAICREMGFDDVQEWTAGLIWGNVQDLYPVHLDDVRCLEPYWAMCSYVPSNPQFPKCDHTEDVLVTCKGHVVSCSLGQYREYRLCRDCPVNTFQPMSSTTTTSCLPCPPNSTSLPGSSSCSCPAGMFWNEDRCVHCPPARVSNPGAKECVPCPSLVRAPSICTCYKGEVWDWGTKQCAPCLSGNFKSSLTETCVPCPVGTTSLVGSQHCICSAGAFWNISQCSACPSGSISQPGALRCQTCPSGRATHNTSCNCPWGWKWNTEGVGGFCERDEDVTIVSLLVVLVVILVVVCVCLGVLLIVRGKRCQGKSCGSIQLETASQYGTRIAHDQTSLIGAGDQ